MDIDENAPGNISQCPVTQHTDNETGFDYSTGKAPEAVPTEQIKAPELPHLPLIDQEGEAPLPRDNI